MQRSPKKWNNEAHWGFKGLMWWVNARITSAKTSETKDQNERRVIELVVAATCKVNGLERFYIENQWKWLKMNKGSVWYMQREKEKERKGERGGERKDG